MYNKQKARKELKKVDKEIKQFLNKLKEKGDVEPFSLNNKSRDQKLWTNVNDFYKELPAYPLEYNTDEWITENINCPYESLDEIKSFLRNYLQENITKWQKEVKELKNKIDYCQKYLLTPEELLK